MFEPAGGASAPARLRLAAALRLLAAALAACGSIVSWPFDGAARLVLALERRVRGQA
jgi:hypothetical protein